MFKHAVSDFNVNAAIPPPAPSVASKQKLLARSFSRTGSTHDAITSPLASGPRQNGAAKPGLSATHARGPYNQGTKRTSGGLVKTLDFQEDMINYPTLNIAGMEKENELPLVYSASARSSNTSLATALFDEDDFDSDIDLDVEDPATKGTIVYPKLPQGASSESRDSGYQSPPHFAQQKIEPDSSQPIPWSSSPLDHFKTPQKSVISKPRAKRAFLPWSQNQQAASTQDPIDNEEEETRPKKRQSTEAKAEVASTPKPKSQYLWNTTASALKQQQKNLREQNKKQTKENDTSVDDLQEAMKKKKKNTVHRIFLSEEQQNVLNLVTEYKKSVFFTGSAGKFRIINPITTCSSKQVPVSLSYSERSSLPYAESTYVSQTEWPSPHPQVWQHVTLVVSLYTVLQALVLVRSLQKT
jgi:ATP-dependent DNA helicase PIF1